MPLYEIRTDELTPVAVTSFATAKLRERADLQRLLRDQIDIIVPDSMVLTEEFADWEDSRRSIDLLVLDRDANLVVVELKRTTDGGHMELQAIRYAAMVSSMTFQQAVEAHGLFLKKHGVTDDPQDRILSFLGWDEVEEDSFAQDVRIVLASADFSKELTTAVLWMNELGLDIRCVRMVPYEYSGKTLLDVQQVIPLPEAVEYQVRVREKTVQERIARHGQGGSAERNYRFWSGLLQKANAVMDLHRNVSPSKQNWVASSGHGTYYSYVVAHGVGRAEFYITRSNKADNKAMFDDIESHRTEIEAAYGAPLSWQRLDERIACRIAANVEGRSLHDEAMWEALQDEMVAAMKRLEAALRPYVEKYRQGGRPDAC